MCTRGCALCAHGVAVLAGGSEEDAPTLCFWCGEGEGHWAWQPAGLGERRASAGTSIGEKCNEMILALFTAKNTLGWRIREEKASCDI